ncbi:hypothetical protein Tco_1054177 [Tanacetum coccineum]|uniref:Uncharacterized protein n=1 Tax=Tanacetum coccineum TaxID=301880 RepID=A0ABQ5GW28_9ASTR
MPLDNNKPPDPILEEFYALSGMPSKGLSHKPYVPSGDSIPPKSRGRPRGVKNQPKNVKIKVQSPGSASTGAGAILKRLCNSKVNCLGRSYSDISANENGHGKRPNSSTIRVDEVLSKASSSMKKQKDWRFQPNGNVRFYSGGTIKVANALSRTVSIIGEPLLPDRVFDFLEDELEPHPAYDFFAPASLAGYAGNPNNNNGWLEADDYLQGELEAMVDEQMVVPAIEEVAEPIVEAEEEQVIAPAVDMEEGQMDVPLIDMEEDLAVLFDDDDFEDDASDGFDEEKVWDVNEEWLMAPTTPPPMLAVPAPSVYEVGGPSTTVAEGPSFPYLTSRLLIPLFVIEDLSIRLGNLEYGYGQLVKKVMMSQMIQAVDIVEHVGAQVEQGQHTVA